jgi:hypothetical protein
MLSIKYCKVKLSRYTPWRRLGGRRYSFYSFLTSALDGGEWSASRPDRALPPGKGPPVPIGQEAGWASEPVWTQRLKEKSSAPIGDRITIVQPAVRHYTEWATAAPIKYCKKAFLGYFTLAEDPSTNQQTKNT